MKDINPSSGIEVRGALEVNVLRSKSPDMESLLSLEGEVLGGEGDRTVGVVEKTAAGVGDKTVGVGDKTGVLLVGNTSLRSPKRVLSLS